MRFTDKKIKYLIKKYKKALDMLEEYDKTRTFPFQKENVSFNLSLESINKIKNIENRSEFIDNLIKANC